MAICVKNTAKDIGKTKSSMPENKETGGGMRRYREWYQAKKSNLNYGRKIGRESIRRA